MKLMTAIIPLVVTTSLPHVVHAQTQPNAGQLLQEQRRAPQLPPPSPEVNIAVPASKATAPGGLSIKVLQVRFNGNSLFGNDELQAVLGDYAGNTYDLAGLRGLAERITTHYRASGYPFARAFLPAQTADTGEILIEILEGRYGQVKAMGEPDVAAAAQPFLQDLRSGEVIDSHSLERSTLVLSDLPGISIYPLMKPGEQVGTGDLAVRVEQNRAVKGSISYDNHGNRYTGYRRFGADLAIDSAMLFGDQLTLNAISTEEDMWLGGAGYSLPIGSKGVRGQFSYAVTDYQLGRDYRDLEATGTANVLSAGATYSLIRSQRTNIYLSALYNHKKLRDKVGFTNLDDEKSSDSLPLSLQFDHRDQVLGGGVTFGSVGWTPGDLSLASDMEDPLGTEGTFSKFNMDVVRLQATAISGLTFYGRVSGQWADSNLDSSEGFSVGGVSGVRAYPGGEASGDSGWLTQFEWRYELGDLAPYLFYDIAEVRANAQSVTGILNSTSELQGGGLGVRYNNGSLSFDTVAAWRNGAPAESDPRSKQPQWWASLSYSF